MRSYREPALKHYSIQLCVL